MRNSGLRRLFSAALPFALWCAALAQDPTKVEPTHYKLAFENQYVQVVNVFYGPHAKSNLHSHPGGVVVVLTTGHLRFTYEDGKTQEVYAKPGEARWFPAHKHRVENLGDTPYSAIYIGVKNKRLGNGSAWNGGSPQMGEQMQKLVAEALRQAQK